MKLDLNDENTRTVVEGLLRRAENCEDEALGRSLASLLTDKSLCRGLERATAEAASSLAVYMLIYEEIVRRASAAEE